MKKYLSIVLALIMIVGVPFGAIQVDAAESEEIVIAGLYQNPNTGIIEDSGGESSYALGQSMVENMMSTVALVEENPDGGYYLTFDLNLYEFISDIEFQLQNEGEDNYTDAVYEIVEEQEETVTVKVSVDNMDSLLRASCYVIPMGRSVVFYIVYSDTFDEAIANMDVPTEDVATDVINEATSDSSASSSNEVLGLTLSSEISGTDDSASSEDGQDIDVVIDGSFWMLLFVLVFCTNIITGSILILGYHLIKKNSFAVRNKSDEEHEYDDEDMLDMDSYGFEVDDEEDN